MAFSPPGTSAEVTDTLWAICCPPSCSIQERGKPRLDRALLMVGVVAPLLGGPSLRSRGVYRQVSSRLVRRGSSLVGVIAPLLGGPPRGLEGSVDGSSLVFACLWRGIARGGPLLSESHGLFVRTLSPILPRSTSPPCLFVNVGVSSSP
jgi:hypothetical protein